MKPQTTIMKTILLVFLSIIFLTSCDNTEKEKQLQTINFETKLNEINEVTPEEKITSIQNDEAFKDWTEKMVNSQISTFYRIDSEEHIELCVEMIAYQGTKFDKKNVEIQIQVEEYVNEVIRDGGKIDKIDSLILKSFDKAVESFLRQREYESKSDNVYRY
jgi:hypothetical protein